MVSVRLDDDVDDDDLDFREEFFVKKTINGLATWGLVLFYLFNGISTFLV